jgi:hypothetical protein
MEQGGEKKKAGKLNRPPDRSTACFTEAQMLRP